MLSDRKFCVVVSSALVLVAFVLVMRFLPELVAWSGWTLCEGQTCNLQGWLSALSGWVAAIVAAFTVFPLYRQLTHQQRQTDFQLGDSSPSLELVREKHGYDGGAVFRIINWNRRQLIVTSLEIRTAAIETHAARVKVTVAGVDRAVDGQRILLPVRITGWENRSAAPHSEQITVRFHVGWTKWHQLRDATEKPPVAITFSGHLNDEKRAPVKLSIDIPLFDFVLT
ncbi:hypothetical protein [Ensifer adhaerens]|uniref:Uncharacterized protein n=1 Tax=Ensifer adhaerens TaxID=106592 RepID=A0A9Q8YBK3_ENSAD|nr:hypothetical protein [Ensifer adhaerens]USJ24694.1 hypothetical protein NE863_06940 [Ensifer adhaerens]